MSPFDPSYVGARRVLLDVLEALAPHQQQLVLVGAQAVYLHTGDSALNTPLMTSDADLAIDTTDLLGVPQLGDLLAGAGFSLINDPGHWVSVDGLAADLMVVPHQSGRSTTSARAAHLPDHGKRAARIAPGLEAALVDSELREIRALDPSDDRRLEARVAGPAALLVAKAIKIRERSEQASRQPARLRAKDALDMFRLLQAVEIAVLVSGFDRHQDDTHAGPVSLDALEFLRQEALSASGSLPQHAAAAAGYEPTVAPSFAILVAELMQALADRSA